MKHIIQNLLIMRLFQGSFSPKEISISSSILIVFPAKLATLPQYSTAFTSLAFYNPNHNSAVSDVFLTGQFLMSFSELVVHGISSKENNDLFWSTTCRKVCIFNIL